MAPGPAPESGICALRHCVRVQRVGREAWTSLEAVGNHTMNMGFGAPFPWFKTRLQCLLATELREAYTHTLSFDPHVKPASLEDRGVGREGGRFGNLYLPLSACSHAQARPIFERNALWLPASPGPHSWLLFTPNFMTKLSPSTLCHRALT